MTKKNHNLGHWSIVLACVVPVYGQTDQNIIRLEMKDRSRHGPPETLRVYVEIATVQPDVEQGIVFTLNIENNGPQVIQILDPIDRTRVSLFSSTLGGKVSLENTKTDSSICKIYTFSDEQLKEIHDNKMARRPFLAFDSEEKLSNRHMKTVSDIVPHKLDRNIERNAVPKSKNERFQAIPAAKLILEAGEHFQAVLQITRIISNPVAPMITRTGNLTTHSTRRQHNPQIVDITSDTYSLRVSLLLMTGIDIADSWSASSDRITIQFGEPNNQGQ